MSIGRVPLQSLLGEQMDYEKWEQILKKEINLPHDVEEGMRLWYDSIQNYEEESIEITWTIEEYCESWKKMSEEKASLPGIHAAHLKCLNSSTQAAEVISRLALVPLLTGYAPKQWKKRIDSMIPKIEGEWRPGKLRLILLMDARFNHNNKLIGRAILQYGEKNGLLAPGRYGSRKEKSAIEHAINKRLTIDITRQAKIQAIYIANDATSCYDHILLMLAYLTMRHYKVSELAAQSSIATLSRDGTLCTDNLQSRRRDLRRDRLETKTAWNWTRQRIHTRAMGRYKFTTTASYERQRIWNKANLSDNKGIPTYGRIFLC